MCSQILEIEPNFANNPLTFCTLWKMNGSPTLCYKSYLTSKRKACLYVHIHEGILDKNSKIAMMGSKHYASLTC